MCHVLVIEDEPLIAMLICDTLIEEGATSFDVAHSEASALRMAAAHPPTVITSDVRLAPGHGPDVVAAIRAAHGEIPTIFISALTDECRPCDHAIAVLGKPLQFDKLAGAFVRAWSAANH